MACLKELNFYYEKVQRICIDANTAQQDAESALKRMLLQYSNFVEVKTELSTLDRNVFAELYAASKSIASFHKFAVGQGLKVGYHQFRKYFAAAEG